MESNGGRDARDSDGFDPLFLGLGVNVFSQASSNFPAFPGGVHGPRVDLQGLDLNSQAGDFADLQSYEGILTGRGGGGLTFGLPPVFAGGRGEGGRAGRGEGGRAGRTLGLRSNRAGRGEISRSTASASASGRVRPPRRPAASAGAAQLHPRGARGDGQEEAAAEEGLRQQGSKKTVDKANWTPQNTTVLCDLCVDQINLGNMDKGQMKAIGYRTVQDNYHRKTHLWHDRGQFKNRIGQLKVLYTNWRGFQKKASGLGRHDDGSIDAPGWWWDKHLQGKPDHVKKLRYGNPEYLPQLDEMFRDCVVDGSSSCIPGHDEEEGAQTDDETDCEETDQEAFNLEENSPMSTSTMGGKKRSSSTSTTASSPSKKSKNPMVTIMKELVKKETTLKYPMNKF